MLQAEYDLAADLLGKGPIAKPQHTWQAHDGASPQGAADEQDTLPCAVPLLGIKNQDTSAPAEPGFLLLWQTP